MEECEGRQQCIPAVLSGRMFGKLCGIIKTTHLVHYTLVTHLLRSSFTTLKHMVGSEGASNGKSSLVVEP